MNFSNEIDPFAAAWISELSVAGEIDGTIVDTRSIHDISESDLHDRHQCHFFAGIGGWHLALRLARWPAHLAVWTGSCPCQPFSQAGLHSGESDPRHLWPELRRLVAACRPPVIFGEQVASPDGRNWLADLRSDLEALGYEVGAADICAASIGSPQIRQRLYWVADSDNSGWKRSVRERQPNPPGEERKASCREFMRPVGRPWPPGPDSVDQIPLLANGVSGVMGGCKGYGNAIVPQVAATFITAYMEAVGIA